MKPETNHYDIFPSSNNVKQMFLKNIIEIDPRNIINPGFNKINKFIIRKKILMYETNYSDKVCRNKNDYNNKKVINITDFL